MRVARPVVVSSDQQEILECRTRARSAPQMDARLLTDENATVDNIRSAFADTLSRAGSKDTVVLLFSGHGTHDHTLAVFDTALADVAQTTLGMDELVAWFKITKAPRRRCWTS
jgi:uncharacterized caspase-like protein